MRVPACIAGWPRRARWTAAVALALCVPGAAPAQTGPDPGPAFAVTAQVGFASSTAPNLIGLGLERLITDQIGVYAMAGYMTLLDVGLFFREAPGGDSFIASIGMGSLTLPHVVAGWQIRTGSSSFITMGGGYFGLLESNAGLRPFVAFEHRIDLSDSVR